MNQPCAHWARSWNSHYGVRRNPGIFFYVFLGMSKYLVTMNPETELTRNALLLYPYILNQTISHGHAAEILGIRKSELIDLYDKLGYSYFDMTMDDLDDELNTFRELKKKETTV